MYNSVDLDIAMFPTDDQTDVLARVAVARNTPSVLVPVGFDWKRFATDSNGYVLLDLFGILPNNMSTRALEAFQLFQTLRPLYNVDIIAFTEFFLVRMIQATTPKINEPFVDSISSILLFSWFPRFQGTDDGHKLEEWWRTMRTPASIVSLMQRFNADLRTNAQHNQRAESLGQKFMQTAAMLIAEETTIGYIERFHIDIAETTGSLFDQLVTTPGFPLARYKTFYKMHNGIRLQPPEASTDMFHDLQIHNHEGEVTIHIQNSAHGVIVQALIAEEVRSIQDVMTFLQLDAVIKNAQRFGLRVEFRLKDAYFDPTLLSDMIMNDALFRKFLAVNDTEKISRQNKSVYVYFRDPNLLTELTEKDIRVGGWNRAFSRYGDLTAILQCHSNGAAGFDTLVRILRSVDSVVVASFKDKIGRFLRLYRELEDEYRALYGTTLPSFQPYKPPSTQETVTDNNPLTLLMKAEPRIFLRNIYGRNCQKVKPLIIEDPDDIAALDSSRKLLFPPVEFEGMKPRYYTCPTTIVETEGVAYPYPGLKKIKKGDHPFGYFPCCYKEATWEHKNKMINKKIVKKLAGDDVNLDKNIDHIITRKTIIDTLGQMGTLPEMLETFFLTLNPRIKYFRVGVPTFDSFMACLEYQHAMKTGSIMRSTRTIRELLLVNPNDLTVGLQENYDLGIPGMIQMIQDHKNPLDPRRIISVMEKFYNVQIVVFSRDKAGNIETMLRHISRSPYSYYRRDRPLVAIFQHWGGTMDELVKMEVPHCELIIGQSFNASRVYTFDPKQTAWKLLRDFRRFFDGNQRVLPVTMSLVPANLLASIKKQWIDPLGKARFLFLSAKHLFPAYLSVPMAPLAVPIRSLCAKLPTSAAVHKFLLDQGIPIVKAVQWESYIFFYVLFDTVDMILPSERGGFTLPTVVLLEHEDVAIRTLLSSLRDTALISVFEQKIRVASILQDYFTYYMAHDLAAEDHDPISIDDWIMDFLNSRTMIVKDAYLYPPVMDIPPYFMANVPGIVKDGRVLVAAGVRQKIMYYLKWFFLNRRAVFDQLMHAREIPSYYQYVDDFARHPAQTIFNSLQHAETITTYPFVKDALESISAPMLIPFYYFNSVETGQVPHIMIRVQTRERAIEVLYIWITEHRVDTTKSIDADIVATLVVDTPTGYDDQSMLQWSAAPGAIGRIAPVKDGTWLSILDF